MATNAFTPRIKIEHVISFSDSVFAFAITLMALSINTPDLTPNLTQSQLIQKLIDMYPQFERYLISFFCYFHILDFIPPGIQLHKEFHHFHGLLKFIVSFVNNNFIYFNIFSHCFW
ncbi:MAG: DUF1211 domain-containing protein [Nitrosopumilus sp.]|nr:DUF1211 domain-containing protein [Nitrosopumilus sp.]